MMVIMGVGFSSGDGNPDDEHIGGVMVFVPSGWYHLATSLSICMNTMKKKTSQGEDKNKELVCLFMSSPEKTKTKNKLIMSSLEDTRTKNEFTGDSLRR
ncbi:hypothetical protein L1987_00347 [Smallanthus sonchifolius]|uniref:Uncharacterized protein n=1 Tax=Smallanthus sonchifolius TaxID=185202 RepID=A0ACB9K243_9ASTR|nr:hypothetical protein L1987_00347 [Smallanthus sonchifolius]